MRHAYLLALAGMAVGCASWSAPPKPRPVQDDLQYLQDGKTTLDEVRDHLGPPSRQYEGGRILTYRLRRDAAQGAVTAHNARPDPEHYGGSWQNGEISLVLVFNPSKVLQKHSFIPVKIEVESKDQ